MKQLPAVSKGQAILVGDELRCNRPRLDESGKSCRKLIAKLNQHGQIAGSFQCERCKEEIEVRLVASHAPAAPRFRQTQAVSAVSEQSVASPRFAETHDFPREVSIK